MRTVVPLLLLCNLACGTVYEPDVVHVVSYNLRWDAPGDGPDRWAHRRDAVATYIGQAPRPQGAFQELTPAQLEFLEARVDGDYVWSPRAHVAAHIPPGHEVIRSEVFELPGGQYARAATLVELAFGTRRLTFVSVHFSGGPDGLMQTEALLEALRDWPRPRIVAGDFNAYTMPTPQCLTLPPEYHVLCNRAYDRLLEAGLTDPIVALFGVQPHSTATGFQPPEARWQPDFDARIDWILVTSELLPEQAWIGDPNTERGRPLSDHRPVHAVLRFAPTPPQELPPTHPIEPEPSAI